MKIIEFLEARISEDEQAVLDWDSDARSQVASMWVDKDKGPGYVTVASGRTGDMWFADGKLVENPTYVSVMWDPTKILRECAAKRIIMSRRLPNIKCDDVHPESDVWHPDGHGPDPILTALAYPYKDHPDFQETWD